MTNKYVFWYATLFLCFSSSVNGDESALPYILMDDDLAELKSDFNAAVDQVRLVFIVGPT